MLSLNGNRCKHICNKYLYDLDPASVNRWMVLFPGLPDTRSPVGSSGDHKVLILDGNSEYGVHIGMDEVIRSAEGSCLNRQQFKI